MRKEAGAYKKAIFCDNSKKLLTISFIEHVAIGTGLIIDKLKM